MKLWPPRLVWSLALPATMNPSIGEKKATGLTARELKAR